MQEIQPFGNTQTVSGFVFYYDMIAKIKRQNAIDRFPNLPMRQWSSEEEDFNCYFPKAFGSYVLTLMSSSYRGHITAMATEITKLTKYSGYEKLIFLCGLETPWLFKNHDYKYANEALEYLSNNKIGKKFNGALQVNTDELTTFIKHVNMEICTCRQSPDLQTTL